MQTPPASAPLEIDYDRYPDVVDGKPYGEFSAPGLRMVRPADQELFCSRAPGFNGTWHGQPGFPGGQAFKYSGGLGTYSAKSRPFAVHASEAGKTFFCWGGALTPCPPAPSRFDFNPGYHYHLVSCYDHDRRVVERPVVLMDKYCADAHDNPVIECAADGHIWVFSPSHGAWTTRSFIHRSERPYEIDRFEPVIESLFAYPQVHPALDGGLHFFHTRYDVGRSICYARIFPDGAVSDSRALASFAQGHYQISAANGDSLVTVFDYHPLKGGLDARTNLYGMRSADGGQSWTTLDGTPLRVPLRSESTPALLLEFESRNELVFLKDVVIDADGRLHVLLLNAAAPGHPGDGRIRTWWLHTWDGLEHSATRVATSTHNFDMGSMFIRPERVDVIAPVIPGPCPQDAGGEVALLRSEISAQPEFRIERALTRDSSTNHTFVRRVERSGSDVIAFWADGDTRNRSPSSLYLCDDDGTVHKLPHRMDEPAEPV